MKCPTCNQHDEFVFEEQARVWRCDRCHERFIIKPRRTNCDASEEFIRVATTNADRIRGMGDEELAAWILRLVDCDKENMMCNPTQYKHSGKCDGRCLQGRLDWLRQPAKEDRMTKCSDCPDRYDCNRSHCTMIGGKMDRLDEIRARCEAFEDSNDSYKDVRPQYILPVLADDGYPHNWAEIAAHSHDDIPYLLARLEEAEAENRWIPVGERLPEDSEPVYVYCQPGRGSVEATMGMMARAHKYTGYTHWMPRAVPEPPKGE